MFLNCIGCNTIFERKIQFFFAALKNNGWLPSLRSGAIGIILGNLEAQLRHI